MSGHRFAGVFELLSVYLRYSPPGQTIIFDVSKPMSEIQASPDEVKSTAIALVKQDSTFLPGSTIGATHWVAYTMTRGMPFNCFFCSF